LEAVHSTFSGTNRVAGKNCIFGSIQRGKATRISLEHMTNFSKPESDCHYCMEGPPFGTSGKTTLPMVATIIHPFWKTGLTRRSLSQYGLRGDEL
jgi:hypothetical protein